jgi:hypothetical protein
VNERLREALRRKIAAHNQLVRFTTVWSATAVALMWCAIYFIARWLTIFGATAVKGLEATMPSRFDRNFGYVVLGWLIVGWIARQSGFFHRARVEKTAGIMLIELFLAPTRVTFGTLQNIRNTIHFTEEELISATDLLVRIVRAGKLRTTAVPVELPEQASRDRVVHGLQLLNLIYLRDTDEDSWYVVADPQRLLAFL